MLCRARGNHDLWQIDNVVIPGTRTHTFETVSLSALFFFFFTRVYEVFPAITSRGWHRQIFAPILAARDLLFQWQNRFQSGSSGTAIIYSNSLITRFSNIFESIVSIVNFEYTIFLRFCNFMHCSVRIKNYCHLQFYDTNVESQWKIISIFRYEICFLWNIWQDFVRKLLSTRFFTFFFK